MAPAVAHVGLNGNTEIGSQDYYVAKYDTSGNLLRVKQLGLGSTIMTALSAATDSAGNVLLTGSSTPGWKVTR